MYAVGQVIDGKYRVEGELGRGGMGAVLVVRHLGLDERFAIKVMRQDYAGERGAIERFRREARAAAKIKSDHVCRVIDVETAIDGTVYMIMEFLEGEDLDKLLRRRGPLPVSEAVGYILQACDALAEAHAMGIVHRDLKPANLFLTHRKNGRPLVKVLDFGISKVFVGVGEQTLTESQAIMGSTPYISPEQARDPKGVDHRSDVWALGVVLYRLLTGQRPFHAQTSSGYIAKIVADPPVPPRHHRPDLPAELEAVLLQCLVKDPSQRMPDVQALALALVRCAPEHSALLDGFVGPSRRSFASLSSMSGTRSTPGPQWVPSAPSPAHPAQDGQTEISDSQVTVGPLETRPRRATGRAGRVLMAVGAVLAATLGAAGAVVMRVQPRSAEATLTRNWPVPAMPAAAEAPNPDLAPPAPVDDAPVPSASVEVEPKPSRVTRPAARPSTRAPDPPPPKNDDPFAYQ